MELWSTIPNEERKSFLSISSFDHISSKEINPRTKSIFSIPFRQGSDLEGDLPRLAESLRHSLLSQVEGFAITGLKFQYKSFDPNGETTSSVLHKYARLDGVVESVREIASNLQGTIIRLNGLLTHEATYKFSGEVDNKRYVLNAEALNEPEQGVEVINPDLVLFHCENRPFEIEMTLQMQKGRGYMRGRDQVFLSNYPLGNFMDILLIPLDANFNPVKKVGFQIKPSESGSLLLFTVETKGNVNPGDAYRQAWDYLDSHTESQQK